MSKRMGDWRDLLSVCRLAADPKKLYLGFAATVYTVVVMIVAGVVYHLLAGTVVLPLQPRMQGLITVGEPRVLLGYFAHGRGFDLVGAFLPLLNPFATGQPVHFLLSVFFWAALLWVWSGTGGAIARLAALEYARDDLPTLAEAKAMVRSRRMSYFFAPLWPVLGIVVITFFCAVGGLVGSLPYVGPIALIVGFPLLVLANAIIVFLAVFGVLAFGMMLPAISVGGKDAFEGWSTAFSYVSWGFGRLVCYRLIAGILGALAAVAAWALIELVIYCVFQTVSIGFCAGKPWIIYQMSGPAGFGPYLAGVAAEQGTFISACSHVMVALFVVLRALSVAFVFAYFFAANTVIFLLMRKHVDNVAIDEVYEEEEEEEAEIPAEPAAGEEEEGADEAAPEDKKPEGTEGQAPPEQP